MDGGARSGCRVRPGDRVDEAPEHRTIGRHPRRVIKRGDHGAPSFQPLGPLMLTELSGSPPGSVRNTKAVPMTSPPLLQVPLAKSIGGGPAVGSHSPPPQVMETLSCSRQHVVLTFPFSLTLWLAVQLPVDTHVSPTMFVWTTDAGGVEIWVESWVCFAVLLVGPVWMPVPLRTGPCCSATRIPVFKRR